MMYPYYTMVYILINYDVPIYTMVYILIYYDVPMLYYGIYSNIL